MNELEKKEFLEKYNIEEGSDCSFLANELKDRIQALPYQPTRTTKLRELMEIKIELEQLLSSKISWLDYSFITIPILNLKDYDKEDEKAIDEIQKSFVNLYSAILKGLYGD